MFLCNIRNPLSCSLKIREDLKFSVDIRFPTTNSLWKKRKTNKKSRRKTKEIIKRVLALFGLQKVFVTFNSLTLRLGMYFLDELYWSRENVVYVHWKHLVLSLCLLASHF